MLSGHRDAVLYKVELELDRRCAESVDFSRVDGSLVGSLVSVDKAGTQPGCQKH